MELTIAVWAVFYAVVARIESPSAALHSAGSVLSIFAYNGGAVVFIIYWIGQPSQQVATHAWSLYQHAFLPVLTLIDAFITPVTFR